MSVSHYHLQEQDCQCVCVWWVWVHVNVPVQHVVLTQLFGLDIFDMNKNIILIALIIICFTDKSPAKND